MKILTLCKGIRTFLTNDEIMLYHPHNQSNIYYYTAKKLFNILEIVNN